ncbi:GntR family transcriptional regulator [Brevibacterium sanguinis]|uniref:GntR family transcriptional regulator n=2 Tax=Brevibacterium TaxID=1696 RepID=A0A366IHD4_9MICO|nr:MULTISPECIES: GntR family transcriptional regulator [Brevibacterium]RBP64963.1 GntR family transcriptional regulator [Brevibacterium sanguinis]RBP71226.1 GntR family transcriptional regulator [Brevibacterium celere]
MTESRLSGDARLPLHVLVSDDLKRRMAEGEWGPDTPLPPERRLADEYGISIGTMRRVLNELAIEGFLIREQGRGTFVRRVDFTSSFTRFFRLGESSTDIPESRIVSTEVRTAGAEVAVALDIAGDAEILVIERHRLVEGAPRLLETIHLPLPTFEALVELPSEKFEPLLYPMYESLCGETITSASEVLHVEPADESDAGHLRMTLAAPIVRIERTARNLLGTPVEYRTSRGQALGFTYRLDIK